MATSRSNLPKEMTPFGKGARGTKKAKPFGGEPMAPPFGGKAKKGDMPAAKPPFDKMTGGKKPKPFAYAAGGAIPAEDGPGHMAAPDACPPSKNPLDDGNPSGGGASRGGGAAIRGKKFRGTF